MLQALPRHSLAAKCRRRSAAKIGFARAPLLGTLALSVALLLTDGFVLSSDASAEASHTAMPVKAPARKHRPAEPRWDLSTPGLDAAAQSYSLAVAKQHAQAISLELTAVTVAAVYIGIGQWGWGETRFHRTNEGWFGKSTDYGGIDKFGHAWSAQLVSDFITWRLQDVGFDKYQSAITAAIVTGVAFFGIEIGDGFSHYGASYEDFVASAFGIGFSFLRNTVPGLAEKVDFRMEYIPTGHGDSLGLGDYSGKKFLFALKLAGFDRFKDTPFRFVEFQAGYFTRGFNDWERIAGIPKTRTPYVGIGLNLSELLFSNPGVRDTPVGAVGRTVLRYIQVPYTYVSTAGSR